MTLLPEQLRRFHAAVTGSEPLESAASLVESGAVAAVARLHVYAHAYTQRIANVLLADYPKLDAALDSLRDLVPDYLRAFPSRHPSLREVGKHMAQFLADRGDHLVDLATLERARVEVFDGPDAAPLRREEVAARPPETFPALALRLVPSSRIVEMTTNADDLWDAIEGASPPPPIAASPRTILVWRREIIVVHRLLEPDEAVVIRGLVTGSTFAAACDQLAAHPAPEERAIALLLRWLDGEILAA